VLKNKETNPLNVHRLRQLDFCPPHFTSVLIECPTPEATEKNIQDWIWENLQGRFYVGPVDISDDGHYHRKLQISFELPEELSYFSLSINQI